MCFWDATHDDNDMHQNLISKDLGCAKTSLETNLLRNKNWKTLSGEEIQHESKLYMKFGSQDFLLS
jgi:hypothetical protein